MRKLISVLAIIISMNQVAFSQSEKGWKILFDGQSLNGWRGYNRSDVPNAWTVENGMLKINRKSPELPQFSGRGDILYDTKFQDFELILEYKVDKGANSGIFYFIQEIPDKPVYYSAPEFQVLDNDNHPDAQRGKNGNRKAGSLYDMIAADPKASNPYGEWNSVRITVKKGKVKHYLNGKKVVEYILWDNKWEEMVHNSKFKEQAAFLAPGGKEKAGYIGLQDHSDNVWFRNIRIKNL